MKIGSKGVLISTTSVLEIAEELLDADHKLLLTSRLTQDCLENLFSFVSHKKPVPSLPDLKYDLKTLSKTRHLKSPISGTYEKR